MVHPRGCYPEPSGLGVALHQYAPTGARLATKVTDHQVGHEQVKPGVDYAIGTLYRRCGCRSIDGRQLGFSCPRLESEPEHGRWYLAAQIDGVDGLRTRVRKGGFASRADAKRALTEFHALPSAQALARTWTVGGFVTSWLVGLEARRSVRPSTLLAYRRVVDGYLVPELGQVRLSKPTTDCRSGR